VCENDCITGSTAGELEVVTSEDVRIAIGVISVSATVELEDSISKG